MHKALKMGVGGWEMGGFGLRRIFARTRASEGWRWGEELGKFHPDQEPADWMEAQNGGPSGEECVSSIGRKVGEEEERERERNPLSLSLLSGLM